MSSMLRSLRFARRLSLGRAERRLGSTLHREVLSAVPARCLAATARDRNYVTRAAVSLDFTGQNLVDAKLNEIDRKIKSFVNIYKKDVEDVLQTIVEKGQIKGSQGLLLIRCCGEFLSSESVQTRRSLVNSIWSTLQQLNIQLDVSHYNALLLVNLENEVDFSPLDILLDMKDKGIEPNRVTFHRLVEQYCNKGDIAGATKILEHMNQQDIPINENIFNSLMKGHSIAGDQVNALKLVDVMKQAGIEPSSRTYTTVMSIYAKTGDIDSINKVLNECKEKDILLSEKEMLEVIYSLAINGQSQHIDQLLSVTPKGSMYNKETISIIHKLLEKQHDEVAYKLLKSLVHHKLDNATSDKGHFFIRKLVNIGSDAGKIIKYCRLMKEDKINSSPFETAIHAAYMNNYHRLAIPLLKELVETGGEMREQYFYPILAKFSKAKDLEDLYDTVKVMVNHCKIVPSVNAVKEFIVSNVSGNYSTVAANLAEHDLPYSVVANAILIHLLEASKPQQALRFIQDTNMRYKTQLIYRPLITAFQKTKDVRSFVDIIHYQYSKLLRDEEKGKTGETEVKEEIPNPVEFSSSVVKRVFRELSADDVNVIEEVLKRLLEKGVNINKEVATDLKEHLGPKLSPESEEILSKLVSETLELAPLKSNGRQRNKLNFLQEKSKESSEFKMVLIQEHARMINRLEVEKQLKELEEQNPTYTIGFCASLIDYYSKTDDIVEADKWYNRLHELYPDCRIDRPKILNYAKALIQNNRPTEALKVLDHPVTDKNEEKDELSTKLLQDAVFKCPDHVEDFFNVLKRNKYFLTINNAVLGPIIKVHLNAGDVDKAVEKFKWCCETYNFSPVKKLLMKELIKREDAKALQHVTDLVTRIQDELQALHDLAIAFFECDRPRQARKILETPGLRLRIQKVLATAERYCFNNEVEKLENLVKLFKGLYVDLDPLYCMLLKAYENEGNSEKCLVLWTQMQEDNIQPSTKFMNELDRILRKLKHSVPFAISQKTTEANQNLHNALLNNDLEAADKIVEELPKNEQVPHLLQMIEANASENDTTRAVQYINQLLDTADEIAPESFDVFADVLRQLGEKDDFPTIIKLLKKLQANSKKHKIDRTVGYLGEVNLAYLNSGQFAKLIDHLKEHIDKDDKHSLNILNITCVLKALEQQPELESSLKEYAHKALKFNYYKPICAVWVHQFLNDSPEAEKTWTEYLTETPNIYPVSAINACIEKRAFDKIPLIVEKVQQAKRINYFEKRRMFAVILRTILATDSPQKYDIAFECLRFASKAIDLDKLQAGLLKTIEENVSHGQKIESLKEENQRTKTEVSG